MGRKILFVTTDQQRHDARGGPWQSQDRVDEP